jgi:hypothetical protein
MSNDLALQALIDARDPVAHPVTDELLTQILAVEQAHAFSGDEDVPLRAIEAIIDKHLKSGDAT